MNALLKRFDNAIKLLEADKEQTEIELKKRDEEAEAFKDIAQKAMMALTDLKQEEMNRKEKEDEMQKDAQDESLKNGPRTSSQSEVLKSRTGAARLSDTNQTASLRLSSPAGILSPVINQRTIQEHLNELRNKSAPENPEEEDEYPNQLHPAYHDDENVIREVAEGEDDSNNEAADIRKMMPPAVSQQSTPKLVVKPSLSQKKKFKSQVNTSQSMTSAVRTSPSEDGAGVLNVTKILDKYKKLKESNRALKEKHNKLKKKTLNQSEVRATSNSQVTSYSYQNSSVIAQEILANLVALGASNTSLSESVKKKAIKKSSKRIHIFEKKKESDSSTDLNKQQSIRHEKLENFLCSQITKLSSELNQERRWRDKILTNKSQDELAIPDSAKFSSPSIMSSS